MKTHTRLSRLAVLLIPMILASASPAQDAPPLSEAKAAKAEAATETKPEKPAVGSDIVQRLAAEAKQSVVVVTFSGRDGTQQGLGSGFVVSKDGLIATNLHVIGEARPISVQFADGKKFDVTEVHATEKASDLAVLRINAANLKPLELGDSDTLVPGQPVIAIGNPLGFKHSVVSGVVSQKREVEGRPMIQVAIPIERGNSGGPLLDHRGRVHGLMTLKSQVTDNLGFAVTINALKPLLKKPNPIPIEQWTTIGALKERDWKVVGARWRQRAGRIYVDEKGKGFGGRSLCLSTMKPPEIPFEIEVAVKFSPDSGAAGLVFHADGRDRHYGFYPSSGRLRLSRFDGPDVQTWNVLAEVQNKAYRQGEWNWLRVRVEKERLLCYVNDKLAIESTDTGFTKGAVGLAKFRDTAAEFKQFSIAKKLPSRVPDEKSLDRIRAAIAQVDADKPAGADVVDSLAPEGASTSDVLRREAEMLEMRAQRLRELALAVQARRVQKEIAEIVKADTVDLLRASLLIAKLDNEELDVDSYLQEIDEMVTSIVADLGEKPDEAKRLAALNDFLFKKRGFHGSRTNYYHRSNSYLNEVIDDREGLPITLSVLYMEVARRLGLKVVGVGLPGHFVVRFEPKMGKSQLLDPFENGRPLTAEEGDAMIRNGFRRPPSDEEFEAVQEMFLKATTPQAVLVRMLANLRNIAERDQDMDSILRYLSTALVIDPENIENRAMRIEIQVRTQRLAAAISDIDWMLEKQPEGMNIQRVLQIKADLEARLQAM